MCIRDSPRAGWSPTSSTGRGPTPPPGGSAPPWSVWSAQSWPFPSARRRRISCWPRRSRGARLPLPPAVRSQQPGSLQGGLRAPATGRTAPDAGAHDFLRKPQLDEAKKRSSRGGKGRPRKEKSREDLSGRSSSPDETPALLDVEPEPVPSGGVPLASHDSFDSASGAADPEAAIRHVPATKRQGSRGSRGGKGKGVNGSTAPPPGLDRASSTGVPPAESSPALTPAPIDVGRSGRRSGCRSGDRGPPGGPRNGRVARRPLGFTSARFGRGKDDPKGRNVAASRPQRIPAVLSNVEIHVCAADKQHQKVC